MMQSEAIETDAGKLTTACASFKAPTHNTTVGHRQRQDHTKQNLVVLQSQVRFFPVISCTLMQHCSVLQTHISQHCRKDYSRQQQTL